MANGRSNGSSGPYRLLPHRSPWLWAQASPQRFGKIFLPDEEIPITSTGLRPGEKIFEEMLEVLGIDKIHSVSVRYPQPDEPAGRVDPSRELRGQGDAPEVLKSLRRIVPGFTLSAADTELTRREYLLASKYVFDAK